MSRVARKSSLSPSATGGNNIDLRKGNDIDLRKGNGIDLRKGNGIDLRKGNDIDLRKGNDINAVDMGGKIDMGRKTQPSVTSGGIGVTQEVGNIGGLTVTGGVSVEVSPLRLSISGHPNYEDPSKSAISIAGSAELPGGILGASGGVTINTSTGEIIGGSIGGEIGGFGINVSSDKGDLGIEFT